MFRIFSIIIETIKDPLLRRSIRHRPRNSEDPPCILELYRRERRAALERRGRHLDHLARSEPLEKIVLRV